MTIELTPEIERALATESARSGQSPASIAMRVLAEFAALGFARVPIVEGSRDVTVAGPREQPSEISEDIFEGRRQAAERIISRQHAAQGEFGPPPGMRWRDWIHQDHKY